MRDRVVSWLGSFLAAATLWVVLVVVLRAPAWGAYGFAAVAFYVMRVSDRLDAR